MKKIGIQNRMMILLSIFENNASDTHTLPCHFNS